MKILYLLRREPDQTVKRLIEEHGRTEEVTFVDVRSEKDYDRIVDLTFSHDRVISW